MGGTAPAWTFGVGGGENLHTPVGVETFLLNFDHGKFGLWTLLWHCASPGQPPFHWTFAGASLAKISVGLWGAGIPGRERASCGRV